LVGAQIHLTSMYTPRIQEHDNEVNDPGCPLHSLANSTIDEINPRPCHDEYMEETSSKDAEDTHEKSSTLADGHEAAALEDANLRSVWQNIMKDFGLTGRPHRNVAVLMLSWANELDDLRTMAEVEKLKCVFKDDFNYKVVQQRLLANKRPGLQVARHLAQFVYDYDSDSTLLIVYYAGHGIPGENPGELHLAG